MEQREQKSVYCLIVNGSSEIFNKECREEEALVRLYAAIAERKYRSLELFQGHYDNDDRVVVDSAWSA